MHLPQQDNKFIYFYFQWPKQLNASLEVVDPEIADIIEREKARQWKVLSYPFLFISLLNWIDLNELCFSVLAFIFPSQQNNLLSI